MTIHLGNDFDSPADPRSSKRGFQYESTLQEVADELGISAERARQIEAKALKKAKAYFERRLQIHSARDFI